jgi:hypothetical protein
MQSITITTILDENHELFLKVKLPDMPPGPVEVTILPRPAMDENQYEPGTREWAQAKLRAVGLLAEHVLTDEEEALAEEMSEEEEEALGLKMAGTRPVEDYVNEDREERF